MSGKKNVCLKSVGEVRVSQLNNSQLTSSGGENIRSMQCEPHIDLVA